MMRTRINRIAIAFPATRTQFIAGGRTMARSILRRSLIALASWVLAQWAPAQTVTQPEAATEVAEGRLEEVLVTAQRRTEDVQKAALSISVFSGDALREAGIVKPDDLMKLAPGLQVAGGTTTQFYVRGVGDFGVT